MAEHLLGHGIEKFELDAHVYLGGPRSPTQHLLWNPANATFDCSLCDTIISTGEITDELVLHALLYDEGLTPFLAGPHTHSERKEIARRYLSGELSQGLLERGGKAARRKPAADSRPTVDHRRQSVQRWMLERYAVHGVFERVVEEALAMQRADRESWNEIADRLLTASTLRRYWQEIDDERVEKAKRAYAQQRKVDLSK
jgi:hypothetical protein